jgi:hypothetical protein
MIQKFCIRNNENRCIQCRDWTPARKKVCPAYRLLLKQAPELLEHLSSENARLTETNTRLRSELVAMSRLQFREEISGVVN